MRPSHTKGYEAPNFRDFLIYLLSYNNDTYDSPLKTITLFKKKLFFANFYLPNRRQLFKKKTFLYILWWNPFLIVFYLFLYSEEKSTFLFWSQTSKLNCALHENFVYLLNSIIMLFLKLDHILY